MSKEIAYRIRKLRELSGLGQSEVSAATGINRSYLSKMETHGVLTNPEKLSALAALYKTSADYIMTGTETIPISQAALIARDGQEQEILSLWRELSKDSQRVVSALIKQLAAKS